MPDSMGISGKGDQKWLFGLQADGGIWRIQGADGSGEVAFQAWEKRESEESGQKCLARWISGGISQFWDFRVMPDSMGISAISR